jgi:hypothetical protein
MEIQIFDFISLLTCRCGAITGWDISGHNIVVVALCEFSLDGTLFDKYLAVVSFSCKAS